MIGDNMLYVDSLKRPSPMLRLTFLASGIALLVAGCGGSDDNEPATPVAAVVAAAVDCADLTGKTVPAASIGLPTGGATVTSAAVVAATDANNTNGEYCKVLGKISPAPAAAVGTPDINFQLNLPSNWNGKTVHMGGGGYNGTVVTGLTAVSFAPGTAPLSQGYATFGSDSGHTGNSGTADFALNEAAIANFGYEHLKKTKDTAFSIINLRYAKAPVKSYFAGASTGGREGMTAAQRYPQEYDGIIANAPAINFSGVRLQGVKIGQAAYGPGGFINPAKQRLILKTAIDACDLDDGAADRIVSNVEACRAKSAAILTALTCISGNDEGDTCLSAAQVRTVRAISDDLVLPYQLAYDVNRHQGYNILQGADFSGSLGLGSSPTVQSPPTFATNGYLFSQGDNYLKYFITKNPSLNSLAFDLSNPGGFLPRLVEMSSVVGAMNPDLSGFLARGGKLLVLHGLADEVISPNPTIAYYKAQVAKWGQAAVDTFWRFYTVPGFGHGSGAFVPSWDAMGALDRWVTDGAAPGVLVGTDTNRATLGRSRPLCPYPTYPRYGGSGSIDNASNYACAAP
jgi:feruloyl esterase